MSNCERQKLLGVKSDQSVCARRCSKADRCLSSGAVLLTLIWTVVIVAGAQFLLQHVSYFNIPSKYLPLYFVGNAVYLSLYLMAGYLADVKLGRYLAVTISGLALLVLIVIEFLFLSILLAVVLLELAKDYSFLLAVFSAPISIVRIMFIANVVQYGTDQLHDSPTDHQSLFIHWYFWAYMAGQFIGEIGSSIHYFYNPWSTKFVILGSVILALFSISAIVVLFVSACILKYRKRWFLMDKVRVNPYKSVFKVTKFAYRHRTPLRRSAFTYCEAKIPSGLDIGKNKYGGPYTTEQVEDVKVFYGILKILLALAPMYFIRFAIKDSSSLERFSPLSFSNTSSGDTIASLFLHNDVFDSLFMVICLPLYLCFIRPVSMHYIPGILKRIGLGMTLALVALVLSFVASVLGDANAQVCNLQSEENGSFTYNEAITFNIVTSTLSSLSFMLTLIASYEFVCSQSPHFMKGLLIGLLITLNGVFIWLASILDYIASLDSMSFSGCGILYYLTNIAVGVLGMAVFIYTSRNYKYRERDDICHVYKYVDDYYSKVVQER